MSTLNKVLRMTTTGLALALSAGAVSNAFAAPVFTVDPSSLGNGVTAGSFDADFVNGGSSARITNTSGFNYDAVGYITYGQFSLNSSPIAAFTSQLGVTYGLYATFTQTFACGSLLNPGTECAVTGLNLALYADLYNSGVDVFNAATLGADPSVVVNGTDVLLGNASFVYSGLAGIDAAGGAYENVTTDFALTPDGMNFFSAPDPFYTLAFSNFNNTSQGITCNTAGCANATIVAIRNENGGSDFNRVPEPETLALMALGLLGMAGISRRRKV